VTPFLVVVPVSLPPSPPFSVSRQTGQGLIKNIRTTGAIQGANPDMDPDPDADPHQNLQLLFECKKHFLVLFIASKL
jgi:hypothetical protein